MFKNFDAVQENVHLIKDRVILSSSKSLLDVHPRIYLTNLVISDSIQINNDFFYKALNPHKKETKYLQLSPFEHRYW